MSKSPRVPLSAYLERQNLIMLALGFSSGLPFLLVGNTFGFWLRDEGITLTTIGLASGVGIAYSLKWVWAPVIDRVSAPFFGRLGRRRGWMLLAQLLIACGLVGMALAQPKSSLFMLVGFAALVAFSSATQDIVIDAWRIETARNRNELGLLTSTVTFGYRVALLATDALILILASYLGWSASYILYAMLLVIGIVACLMAKEPEGAESVLRQKSQNAPLWSGRGLFDAIVGPFQAFFRTHGLLALVMLLAISLFNLPDFLRGPMVNPFYHDLGLTKSFVGSVRGTLGLMGSFCGIAAGGFVAARFGITKALVTGGILQACFIASFALLAHQGPNPFLFCCLMAGDSFSTSFAGVSLVTYMSSLTSLGYTATQYALLTSAYTIAGKILKTMSGAIIDLLKGSFGLMEAYAVFFIAAGLIGIPAILLFLLLGARARRVPET